MLQDPLYVPHTSGFSGLRKRVTKVRIPISPPASPNCRETAPPVAAKYAKHAGISRYFVRKVNRRERTARDRMASIFRTFSGEHLCSPVSGGALGECNATANR